MNKEDGRQRPHNIVVYFDVHGVVLRQVAPYVVECIVTITAHHFLIQWLLRNQTIQPFDIDVVLRVDHKPYLVQVSAPGYEVHPQVAVEDVHEARSPVWCARLSVGPSSRRANGSMQDGLQKRTPTILKSLGFTHFEGAGTRSGWSSVASVAPASSSSTGGFASVGGRGAT